MTFLHTFLIRFLYRKRRKHWKRFRFFHAEKDLFTCVMTGSAAPASSLLFRKSRSESSSILSWSYCVAFFFLAAGLPVIRHPFFCLQAAKRTPENIAFLSKSTSIRKSDLPYSFSVYTGISSVPLNILINIPICSRRKDSHLDSHFLTRLGRFDLESSGKLDSVFQAEKKSGGREPDFSKEKKERKLYSGNLLLISMAVYFISAWALSCRNTRHLYNLLIVALSGFMLSEYSVYIFLTIKRPVLTGRFHEDLLCIFDYALGRVGCT